ncbi:MAG: hypothetical protein L0387_42665 [Acidobacteria bacterium]|nr:hypothetical protein [Acidobacteriota bacterium]MCI0721987.1 hypothetical protein [Acidobacteriota bacterium]
MKHLLSVFIVFLLSTAPIRAADYVIEEMIEEGSLPPPFSIARVEPFPDGLRLFLSSADIAAVAGLVASGALRGQLSDNGAGTETSVTLSLGKAVWCTRDSEPVYLGYAEALPACSDTGQLPQRVEYFLISPVTLGASRDLAIGKDPDYLWLIEER